MPDITMCSNNKCPIRDKCYRYLAKPSERQAYRKIELDLDVYCDYFMKSYVWRNIREVGEVDKKWSEGND